MRANPFSSTSRRALLAAALFTVATLAGCVSAPQVPPEVRAALAPTGALRVAVYPGSPTSLVEQAPPEQMRGVTVDLGRSLASRLGVPAQFTVYPRLAEALAALQRGDADFTITNATAERQRIFDFAPTLVDLELGVLVPAGSRLSVIESLDQAGLTLGVTQGSSSERTLGSRLKQTKLRTLPTLDAARAALVAREMDGYATNKGILFDLAERVPGSRVLEGRWGTEHLAPAIPKGRDAGKSFVDAFTKDVRSNGELDKAAARAGLRGFVPPAP